MSGFKKLKQPDKLALKQRGGAVVFLESEEDFQIVAKRWFFDEGEDVYFQPADTYEQGPGGGGCKAVIDLVVQARADGIKAFGLVDRDVLLSDQQWDLWWQEQDPDFLVARPYGEHIRVLLRWELENYLLDPDAMAAATNDASMTSAHTGQSIAASCLIYAEELIDKSAAAVAATAANCTPPAAGFGCNPMTTGTALSAALLQHINGQTVADVSAEFSVHRQRISAFDSPAASPARRWERLTRMLDGKAALKYLGCCIRVPFDAKRAELARRMRETGAVPTEIRGYVEDFKNAAGSGPDLDRAPNATLPIR